MGNIITATKLMTKFLIFWCKYFLFFPPTLLSLLSQSLVLKSYKARMISLFLSDQSKEFLSFRHLVVVCYSNPPYIQIEYKECVSAYQAELNGFQLRYCEKFVEKN